MEMTPARWAYTTHYLRDVFGQQDQRLADIHEQAAEAGLPPIAVSPDVGRFLSILVAGTDAKMAVEVGTLGGYSGAWIARALRPGGRLITIECEDAYATFAEKQFDKLGASDRVEVRRGRGIEVLQTLTRELGSSSIDVLFLDALKTEYPQYWRAARTMVKPGGLLIADNTLGTSEWWIDDEANPERQGADALNRALAADAAFDAVTVPLRQGILIARRRSSA